MKRIISSSLADVISNGNGLTGVWEFFAVRWLQQRSGFLSSEIAAKIATLSATLSSEFNIGLLGNAIKSGLSQEECESLNNLAVLAVISRDAMRMNYELKERVTKDAEMLPKELESLEDRLSSVEKWFGVIIPVFFVFLLITGYLVSNAIKTLFFYLFPSGNKDSLANAQNYSNYYVTPFQGK